MITSHSTYPAFRRGVRLAAGASMLLVATACTGLLDVKNPNNVAESSLANPSAAGPQASGALASTMRMLSSLSLVYAESTDEMDWIGSRDAWNDLDTGAIANYSNEFSDDTFKYVGEARYLVDQTIARLEAFDKEGTLTSRADLMRTYQYAALVYATIADTYDDFVFSNKTVAAAPIGRANMSKLYDTAVSYLDKALAIATSNTDRYNITAYRARVKHAKGVWAKVTPVGASAPGNPLVNDAGAVADANAAIALGSDDQKFTLVNNLESTAGTNVWYEVNGRNESAVGVVYKNLKDPISNALDPVVQASLAAFKAFGTQSGTFTITSTRELRLILAEAALAGGNTGGFTSQINTVRALGGKPAFTGQIANNTMLAYERQAQLWLMGRRLSDMYRFGQKDPRWTANANYASAFNVVGLFFPIAQVERLGNPCVADATKCK